MIENYAILIQSVSSFVLKVKIFTKIFDKMWKKGSILQTVKQKDLYQ